MTKLEFWIEDDCSLLIAAETKEIKDFLKNAGIILREEAYDDFADVSFHIPEFVLKRLTHRTYEDFEDTEWVTENGEEMLSLLKKSTVYNSEFDYYDENELLIEKDIEIELAQIKVKGRKIRIS